MMDSRQFSDSYDLYRPTVSTSTSGEQKVAATTATSEDNPCLWFPKPGRFAQGPTGIALEYDAIMLVPYSADLRPAQEGQQPDQVVVSSRRYVVLVAWPAAGREEYKRVLLRELI